MDYEYHVCGKSFVGCPGDASEFARRLEHLWDELPISGVKPPLYHWNKHFDPFSGTAAIGSQYQIERTSNPSVNPVFILFAQTVGTPVRPPPEGWDELRKWLDSNGWHFIALLGRDGYVDADAPPGNTIPLTGTMFELFDAMSTGNHTSLIVYDLSSLVQPPNPDTPEHQRQRAWRERLIREFSKTTKPRAPETVDEFEVQALKDLKQAFNLPKLDPLHGRLPSLAAVGVYEPLLFGRGPLIDVLSTRIMVRGAAVTRVLGVSGTGKSSLLRAGLMGTWFDRSRGQAGLLAKTTALLVEPIHLTTPDPDPLRALGLLLTGCVAAADTQVVGPFPGCIAAPLPDLPALSGNRSADLVAARGWWQTLTAQLEGPVVLVIDQAEQIDAEAKREARSRIESDPKADPRPVLSPAWRRLVDLLTSLAGIADPTLQPPPPSDPARFRLVLGLHRESAIRLWDCDPAALAAYPPIDVPPLEDWRDLIQGTIEAYGLRLEEKLLATMASEAARLTRERPPIHLDDQVDDTDSRYDRASVLPMIKVAIWRLLTAWRQQVMQSAAPHLRDSDKMLTEAALAHTAGIADSVDALGEAAIALWLESLSNGRAVDGMFEREAFNREWSGRFDRLFTSLIDVGEKGRPELSYIRRDGLLAEEEALLLSALDSAELLIGPDAEHWRLPHRTMIENWQRGRDFIKRHETRLSTKQRLLLSYRLRTSAAEWHADDIASFIDLAFGWIGNDDGEDAELRNYLRGGITARFIPAGFSVHAENPLNRLPVTAIASGEIGWADHLFKRAAGDPSWDEKGGLWALIAAVFNRPRWLERMFAPAGSRLRRQFADLTDAESGGFPLVIAAQQGHAECVERLLAAGAEPNRTNAKTGTFPLLQAAQEGHAECVERLLAAGAEPNRTDDKDGTFPLLMVAQNGHAECVERLLAAGAEPLQRHLPSSITALEVALRLHRWGVVRLLGQRPNVLDSVSLDIRAFIEALIASPDANPKIHDPDATEQAIDPASAGVQPSIDLPISPGYSVTTRVDSLIYDAVGISFSAIEPDSVATEAWRLSSRGDALMSLRFSPAGEQVRLHALVFDLQSVDRTLPCRPGFDFNGLALSLQNAGGRLDLRDRTTALMWASLVLTYEYAVTPILPSSAWPLVPGTVLPQTALLEEDWRRWDLFTKPAGLLLDVPFLHEGKLLRGRFNIPDNGVGVQLVGHPQVIMSGLRVPVPRFVSIRDGAPAYFWLVQDRR